MLKDICTRFNIMYENQKERVATSIHIPEDPFYAEADEALLTRSVTNLLKNAYDAVGENGTVTVIAEENRDSLWNLTITDTGPGIKAGETGKIFEPFFINKTKGTGLGLAFVKHAVTAHGGDVQADNSHEGGAVFSVTLPGM